MVEYSLVRSKRKTVSLEITESLTVLVRAPLKMSVEKIDAFVLKHGDWIEKHLKIAQERREREAELELSDSEIKQLKKLAKERMQAITDRYAAVMGLKVGEIKITCAKKRYGSCSPDNRICYSYLLMLYPEEAAECVAVHELAHFRHKNHSKAFYKEVLRYMPDYYARHELLRYKDKTILEELRRSFI